jgi:hypothetical protein
VVPYDAVTLCLLATMAKSQVSEMVTELDAHVEEFRTRRLDDTGPVLARSQAVRAVPVPIC